MKKNTKKSILAILALGTVTTATVAVAGCNKKDTYTDKGEQGSYYYVGETGDYRLVLEKGEYFLFTPEGTTKGKYSYNAKTNAFTFDGDVVSADEITPTGAKITVNGTKYDFYKQIYYAVTYDVEGTQNRVNVINGKAVAKPTDASRDGYIFVGWYTDAEYKTAYDFNAPVTEDITLYARFVAQTPDGKEYNVTLVSDGETVATVKTVGGVAIDLAVPEKEGKKFVGWWMSDYDDPTKLTTEYTDQVLVSDVTLYAVWEDAQKTMISVNGNEISWTSAGTNVSYTVTVTKPNGETEAPKTVNTTKTDYDFAGAEAGDYVIAVTANGYTTTAYYKNKALAKVCKFEVVDSVLVFEPVANAEEYVITVVCGKETHVVNNGTSASYYFGDCEMKEDGIEFTVTSIADGYAQSVSNVFVVNKTLGDVTGLQVDATAQKVVWNNVRGATEYEVEVKAGNETVTYTVTSPEVSLKYLAPAEYTVKVTAKSFGYNSASATTTYDKTTVAAPTQIVVANNTVTWAEVEGATGYTVKINGVEYETEETEFELPTEVYDAGVDLTVTVKANGSVYADDVAVKYNAMGEVTVKAGVVAWEQIANAKNYLVKVNGGTAVKLDGNVTTYKPTFTATGVYTVEVAFESTYGKTSAWKEVYVNVYEVNFNALGGSTVESAYVAEGDTYVVGEAVSEYNGYDFAGWYSTPNGNTKYEQVKVYGNTTLYAGWTAKQYNATFNLGDIGVLGTTTAKVTYKEKYTLPVPTNNTEDTRMGFVGWYYNGVRVTDENGVSYGAWTETADGEFEAGWYALFSFLSVDNDTHYSVVKGAYTHMVKSVTVPTEYMGKPVTIVDGGAFRNLRGLEQVNIPDSIKLVETGTAFANCSSLAQVNVYETSIADKGGYSSVNGILLYRDTEDEFAMLNLAFVPVTEGNTFIIPEGVEVLPVAILNSTNYKRIVIPGTVKEIQDQAFYRNYKLEEIVFANAQDGIERSLTIGVNAFGYCSALSSITLPARLSNFSVEDEIFTHCVRLQSVNISGTGSKYKSVDGVLVSADNSELVFCPAFRTGEYVVPATVTKINDNAFRNCTELTKVVISGNVDYIGKNAFAGCSKLTQVVFEGTVQDFAYSALTIDEGAFADCLRLKEITLPENLNEIKAGAFAGTTVLTKVTFDSYFAVVEAGAFENVNEVYIGKHMTAMDIDSVFAGSALKKVEVDEENTHYEVTTDIIYNEGKTAILYVAPTITGEYVAPATLTAIKDNAFKGANITSVTLPATIETIGASAFEDSKITTVTFTAGTVDATIGESAFKNTKLTAVAIPNNYTAIGVSAFENCTALTTATLPNGLTSLENDTFKGCTALATVTIPESVTVIGTGVFAGTAVTTMEIPANVTILSLVGGGLDIFEGCDKLETITVAQGNANYTAIDGILYEKHEGVADTVLYAPLKADANEGNLVVGANVVSIAAGAFKGNTGVKNVTFAGTVNEFSFGKNAFTGSSIETVVLPQGLKEIPSFSFDMCHALKSVFIPKTVEHIEESSFSECFELETVTFEEGGTAPLTIDAGRMAVGDLERPTTIYSSGAFAAAKIKSLKIPARTAQLGAYTFYMCDQLETLEFENGFNLTEIEARVFYNCKSLTAINVPESVQTIGDYAFYGCSAATAINLGNNVKTIGQYALALHSQLTSITIPASVEVIGNYALYGFTSGNVLETVTFATGSNIKEIKAGAFAYTNLTSFEFPENSNTIVIGDGIFSNVSTLTSITITSSVDRATMSNIFSGNTSALTADNLLGNGATFVVDTIDGLTFTSLVLKDGNGNVTEKILQTYTGTVPAELTIPNGVTEILDNAFKSKTAITKVTLPASLKKIGAAAFYGLTKLTMVEFQGTSQLEVIGDQAFRGCTAAGFTTFTLPDSVKSIGIEAFYGCTKMTTFNVSENSQLEKIGAAAFYNCSVLTSFYMPDTVTSLGGTGNTSSTTLTARNGQTFYGCAKLATVRLSANIKSLGYQMFYNCSVLKNVTIPENVETLGAQTFYGCKAITEIVIPENVTHIGRTDYINNSFPSDTFYNCTALTKVTCLNTNIQSIGGRTFYGCTKLKEVVGDFSSIYFLGNQAFYNTAITSFTVPNTLTLKGFGTGVFQNCKALTDVTLEEGLTQIPANTFVGCTALKSITIPESVTEIAGGAFTSSGIEEFVLNKYVINYMTDFSGLLYDHEGNILYSSAKYVSGEYELAYGQGISANAFDGCVGLTKIILPETITAIPDFAFRGCTNLEEIVIRGDITSIGANAFQNCTKLTKLTVPEGVQTIGNYAFDGCTNLEEITVPSTLKSIGTYAFQNCAKITKMNLPEGLTTVGYYAFNGCTQLANVNLPSTLNSAINTSNTAVVGTLANYLFQNCTALTTVTVPEGIKYIGNYAFKGCTALTTVTVPENLERILDYAFNGCSALVFEIPQTLKHIGMYAFQNCISLKRVDIPASVAGYQMWENDPMSITPGLQNAFQGCTGIEEATFASPGYNQALTAGGLGSLFAGCTSLRKVTFSAPVFALGATFNGCTALTEVIGLSGATTIRNNTFMNCTSLTSITIPSTVTSIANGAFTGCTSLTSINLENVKQLFVGAFKDCTALTEITLGKVTSIGANTFEGCTNLKKVTLTTDLTTLAATALTASGIPSDAVIYVPYATAADVPTGIQAAIASYTVVYKNA